MERKTINVRKKDVIKVGRESQGTMTESFFLFSLDTCVTAEIGGTAKLAEILVCRWEWAPASSNKA